MSRILISTANLRALSWALSLTLPRSAAGYLMLLWFWGSGRKRAFFASTRKQLASYLKVSVRGIWCRAWNRCVLSL